MVYFNEICDKIFEKKFSLITGMNKYEKQMIINLKKGAQFIEKNDFLDVNSAICYDLTIEECIEEIICRIILETKKEITLKTDYTRFLIMELTELTTLHRENKTINQRYKNHDYIMADYIYEHDYKKIKKDIQNRKEKRETEIYQIIAKLQARLNLPYSFETIKQTPYLFEKYHMQIVNDKFVPEIKQKKMSRG